MSDYKKAISNNKKATFRMSKKMKIDNESVFFHNDIEIQSWLNNPKVDATQKVFIILLYFFTLEDNKDVAIDERIKIQNTRLMEYCNIQERSTIQKALRYLTEMGIIEDRIYLNKGDRYSLKGTGVKGLTNRRIIINLKRAKEFLKALPSGDFFNKLEKRSRERRLIYRRPLSLVDYLNAKATSTQVSDINQKRDKHHFNTFIENQLEKYGNFIVSDVEAIVSASDTDKERLLDSLYRLISGDMVPLDLKELVA